MNIDITKHILKTPAVVANEKFTILIPYRENSIQNRKEQLEKIIPFLENKLNNKKANFEIYIIEQSDDNQPFNRGALLNIGAKLASKNNSTYVIFHDVDLLPDDSLVDYYLTTPKNNQVIHIGSQIKKYDYDVFFGAVVSFSLQTLKQINGFPNTFWGWGGEDDCILRRFLYNVDDAKIIRPIEGNFTELHTTYNDRENPLDVTEKDQAIVNDNKLWKRDGLNQCNYFIQSKKILSKNIKKYTVQIKNNNLKDDIYTKFALNTEDPEINFQIAVHYHNIGQTASAFTHYFRCAERTEDELLKYECFIRSYMCFAAQGKREFTAVFLLKQAINILPNRPEAYYLLSKHYEYRRDWMECYTLTTIAKRFCDFHSPKLREWTEYSGEYSILFQNAVAAWWLDKADESWKLFNYILDNFTLPENYIQTINNNINNHFKDRKRENKKKYECVITLPNEIKQTKKVVDCFPFYAKYGREMFELRYNTLKDHVDYFVLSELNTTHTGKPIEWEAKKLIQELNIPQEKVIVIEIAVPQDDELPIEQVDKLNCMHGNDKNLDSVKSRCRERIQRDAILQIYEKFDDDTVFINSDLDEIINPKYIEWFANTARQNKDRIIKVPLVYLQGKANLRAYYINSDTPAPWNENLFLCLKDHYKNTTPTKVRSCKLTTYPIGFVTSNNRIIEDAGWHFSWMGDANIKKIKQESFIHFTDKFNFVAGGGYNSDELNNILTQETDVGQIPPNGEIDKVLKYYDINLLPKEVFTLERVKSFLLPGVSSHKRISLDSLDTILSSIYGFCSVKKASILINLILDNKPEIVVELGVLEGSSLIPQALAVKQNSCGRVYAIDPWSQEASLAHTVNDEHKNYWGTIDHETLFNNFKTHLSRYNIERVVEILRQTSLEASKAFFINSIDLLHVDGNHSEEQSYEDVVTYLPLVKPGGYILFDDVHWTDGGKNTTQKAVKHLQQVCNDIGTHTDEIGNCFTVFQKK